MDSDAKCERCGGTDCVGRWRSGQWSKLCTRCKLQVTLTPERTAKLERDLRRMFGVDDDA